MIIYFTGSQKTSINSKIIKYIQPFGKVMGDLQMPSQVMTPSQSNRQRIHDHDLKQLEMADVVIAEVTKPNLRAGYELCLAAQLDIPNVVLYHSDRSRLPGIIMGSRKLSIKPYQNWSQVQSILRNFLIQFKS